MHRCRSGLDLFRADHSSPKRETKHHLLAFVVAVAAEDAEKVETRLKSRLRLHGPSFPELRDPDVSFRGL